MIRLRPQFLTKQGKKEFAVFPYEEFVAQHEWLDDASDLLDPREARAEEASAEAIPLCEVKKTLDLT